MHPNITSTQLSALTTGWLFLEGRQASPHKSLEHLHITCHMGPPMPGKFQLSAESFQSHSMGCCLLDPTLSRQWVVVSGDDAG